jgi:hypothetical protein
LVDVVLKVRVTGWGVDKTVLFRSKSAQELCWYRYDGGKMESLTDAGVVGF